MKKMLKLTPVLAMACMVLATQRAEAIVAPVVADSYIDTGNNGSGLNTNFNTSNANQLRVKNAGGNNFNRKAFVRFDTSGIGLVDDATFTMNFFDTNAGNGGGAINWEFEVYGLADGDAGENWAENVITWNNAPANDVASSTDFLGNATSLGTFSFLGRTSIVNFSSAALTSFVNADNDGLLTLMVARNTPEIAITDTYVHAFGSSENGQIAGPSLNVSVVVPEPTTAALGLLGMAGLGLRRRQRSC